MLTLLTKSELARKLGKIYQIPLLVFILFLNSCQQNAENEDNSVNVTIDTASLTLDQKIGQMLIVGFRGLTVEKSRHIQRDIKDYNIGGVVLFSVDLPSKREQLRNIESPQQFKQLCENLQKLAPLPLIISVDQEGGRVSRLSPKYGFPPRIPSAQYLGELNNLDSTEYYANQTAQLLASMGVNFNFAPVVDVNVNPACPVIGGIERSFSPIPDSVTAHAKAVIQGHRASNIITSLKHFPGHGSAKTDSHLGFTDVSETWSDAELKPYQDLIKDDLVDAVMTAHVFNSKFDAKYPATLSKNITHHFLREEFGFKGIIVSDDMHMGAIAENFELEEAIEKAIEAGVDMLIFGNNQPRPYDEEIVPKVITIIKKLIADGKVSEERIEESFERIMTLKERLK